MSHYHVIALRRDGVLIKLEMSTKDAIQNVVGKPYAEQFNTILQKEMLSKREYYVFASAIEEQESLDKRYSEFSDAALRPDTLLKTREVEYTIAENALKTCELEGAKMIMKYSDGSYSGVRILNGLIKVIKEVEKILGEKSIICI